MWKNWDGLDASAIMPMLLKVILKDLEDFIKKSCFVSVEPRSITPTIVALSLFHVLAVPSSQSAALCIDPLTTIQHHLSLLPSCRSGTRSGPLTTSSAPKTPSSTYSSTIPSSLSRPASAGKRCGARAMVRRDALRR